MADEERTGYRRGDEPPEDPDRPRPRPGKGAPEATRGPVCDLCGATMLERHCKLVCKQCGYQRDCSDP